MCLNSKIIISQLVEDNKRTAVGIRAKIAFRATALEKANGLFILSTKQDAKSDEGREGDLCIVAVLAEQEAERQRYAEQITRFCEAKGCFRRSCNMTTRTFF